AERMSGWELGRLRNAFGSANRRLKSQEASSFAVRSGRLSRYRTALHPAGVLVAQKTIDASSGQGTLIVAIALTSPFLQATPRRRGSSIGFGRRAAHHRAQ